MTRRPRRSPASRRSSDVRRGGRRRSARPAAGRRRCPAPPRVSGLLDPPVDDGQGAGSVQVVGQAPAHPVQDGVGRRPGRPRPPRPASAPAAPRPRRGRPRSRPSRRGSGGRAAPAGSPSGRGPSRRSAETNTRLPLRLRHLLAVEADHAGVHVVPGERPVAGQRPAPSRGAHLVVREHQVACRRPARRSRRRGAPARSPCTRCASPGRPAPSVGVPGRLARPRGLPEQAVQRVLLARPVRVAAALGEQRAASSGSSRLPTPPNRGSACDREVDVAVDVVRRAALAQRARPRSTIGRDRLDGADEVARREHARARSCPRGTASISRSASAAPVLAVARGALEQRVVDVGDVLHVVHLVPGVAPGPVRPGRRRRRSRRGRCGSRRTA